MKRIAKISAAFMAALITVISCSAMIIPALAAAEPTITVSAPSAEVVINKTMQLTASVTAPEGEDCSVTWSSSDKSIAAVSANGTVTGKGYGRATITATVARYGISDSFVVYVERRQNVLHDMFAKKQRLSYRYSYKDDYFYADDKDCWQDVFGFFNLYDLVSPWYFFEYDYTRVYFTYDNLDWMIQLWKGQYGLIFYGSEIGVYTKKMSDKEVTAFTQFNAADENNWLDMGMTLYRDTQDNGVFVPQFTRDYDRYWWCTGFKYGRLNDVEPADELRMSARITLKDSEMTALVAQGFRDCGFKQATTVDALTLDSFCVDDNDIHILWQNNSEAENTVAIKTAVGVVAALGILNAVAFFLFLILGVFAVGGIGLLLFLI